VAADLTALRTIIDATGLFPSAWLDAMAAGYLTSTADGEAWLTADDDGRPVAVAYYAPEPMTDGTWNVRLIAVHPDRQGRGYGVALMRRIEDALAARGARVLLVETSGRPAFAGTRAFYHARGYEQAACIREFYAAGDDKVVFRKALAPAVP
jgi:GNAT superfamily N-acetyltransferase